MTGVTAAVLAGGLGTRLRSVVADRPKVLAPVAGRPFLSHLLDQLARAGVRETILLVGHGADQVRAEFGGAFGSMHLAYSAEPEPLGTGGAIRLALPHLTGKTILLLNGDSYCDVSVETFLAFHCAHAAGASLTLAHVEDASRFGRVRLGGDHRITRFEEKEPTLTPGWINAGIYLFERQLLEAIPGGRAVSLEREVFPAWVAAGMVYGFTGGGRFIDIGVPESYAAAGDFLHTHTQSPSRE